MASVTNATIALGNVVSDKRDVTVAGTLAFDAGDVGKTYRLEIKVFGEDKSGDNLPSGDGASNDLLYTYSWPGVIFPVQFKNITVAGAGNVNFSEKRTLDSTKFDEDAGIAIVGWADKNTPITMPRKDEVYATATLSGAPSTVKTATIVAGLGV
jgi:hypothetical protein